MENKDEECIWITDCGACGSKTLVTWKEAVEEGCQVCCSHKTSIYHQKSEKK